MNSISRSDLDVRHIHGPPGSGKTERAMGLVQQFMESGEPPDSLGFTTFTRGAVRTFETRLLERTGLRSREELPFIGTIHSICFRLLALRRSQIMINEDWSRFCEAHKLAFTPDRRYLDQTLFEPTTTGTKDADQLRAFYERYRNMSLNSLEDAYYAYPWYSSPPSFARVQQFIDDFDAFRADTGKLDFTDILNLALQEGVTPTVERWIVDEAQDLNPLQRDVLFYWLRRSKSVAFFSDINQTVYTFAGANPSWLMDIPVTEDLHRSRRVPRKPRDLAVRLISRNAERYETPFEARPEDGDLQRTWSRPLVMVNQFPMNGETTAVLVRNRFLLKPWIEALRKQVVPFHNLRGFSPLRDVPRGVKIALQIGSGLAVSVRELSALLESVLQKDWLPRGIKAQVERMARFDESRWLTLADIRTILTADRLVDLLSNINTCLNPLREPTGEWKSYLVQLVRKFGMDVLHQPEPVTLSTIHGVKGMEFSHVYLSIDLSKRSWQGIKTAPQDERRIFYVGATRCKISLHLLRSTQSYHYRELI